MTNVTSRPFGMTKQGQQATLYTMSNGNLSVDITDYGATIVAIRALDAASNPVDVVLGYDSVLGYQENEGYFGAVIGRNGNRIKNATFEVRRQEYKLHANEKTNSLHSGPNGFDSRMWNVLVVAKEGGSSLECTLNSPHMDQGFPGNLQVCVRYSISSDDALIIEYFAKTDQDTVVNLTNHSYFNLNGHNSGSIEKHRIKLAADFYTPVDEDCCPTGEILSVKDTLYDFTEYRIAGENIDNIPDHSITGGYDHNFILRTRERQMTPSAWVVGDQTGIYMQMFTNQPAVQFYTGNMVPEVTGKGGAKYERRAGLCLETQCSPNALANPHFTSPILRPGDIYNYTTVYRFSVFDDEAESAEEKAEATEA